MSLAPSADVLSLIGNTPVVELRSVVAGCCRLFVKLESHNPGGSIKDRIGRSMIEASDDPEGTRETMLNAVRQQIDPYIAAGNAMIDDIIDPRETRETIARALRMARTKEVTKPRKRHGVMPV